MYVQAQQAQWLLSDPTDEKIVQLVCNGYREDFSVVYQRYQQKVYRLAFGMTGHQEQAADLTQEIFVKVYEALPSFREHSSFSTWLYRIALNHCLNHCRKQRRSIEILNIDADELYRPPVDRDDLPDSKAISQELQQILRQALLRLKPMERAVIILKDVEGLSYSDIATRLQCSQGTVASRLSRARTQLESKVRHLKGRV